MINVLNHYWVIADSATDVYSSAINTLVPNTDQAFTDWSVAYGGASPIPNEAELAGVLQPYNTLPAWLFNATDTFIQPSPSTYTKGQLAAYNADARFRRASGGIVVTSLGGTVPFLSDPISRNTINSAYQYAVANPSHITDWKMSDGSFINLTLAQLTTLNDDMAVFVQGCFTCESTNLTSINSGSMTTLAAIDAAFNAISNTFP